MIRLEMKNYNNILAEKLPKYMHCHQTNLMNMNILQASKYYHIIKNKRELQQTALNHSSDIDFKGFSKIYQKCTAEPYSFLVNDATLASDNPLRFGKNL